MSDLNSRKEISREEAMARIAALKGKMPAGQQNARPRPAASLPPNVQRPKPCNACKSSTPSCSCRVCRPTGPTCPTTCPTGATGATGATGPIGECDTEHRLIGVDDYLVLSEEERRTPGIQWIIYPNDYINFDEE